MNAAPWTAASETPEIHLARLAGQYGDLDGIDLVRAMIDEFDRDIAMVTSCGAEAAVLLDLVARTDPAMPVVFLDTGLMFSETLAYAETLRAHFGLRDFRVVKPDPRVLAAEDPDGTLWRRDADRCCHLRKVLPLERALAGFAAWMTGLKRYHNFVRQDTKPVERVNSRFRISPLAAWTPARVAREFAERNLPRHPLVAEGYPSIGCKPCTSPVRKGDGPRAGRWPGQDKTECGIHQPVFGKGN